MSKFYLNTSNSSSSSSLDNLPYPLALPRSDFLTPFFSAPTYLSTLSSRHQTLEDLRSDLLERSKALSAELLSLVNDNYEQFLSLGADLKGGEERVEGVRVGLLGFQRGVGEVRERVRERKVEAGGLLKMKREVRGEIAVGRGALEVNDRLEELEERLMVASLGRLGQGGEETWSESEDEDGDEEGELGLGMGSGGSGASTRKLKGLVDDCRTVERLVISVGKEHPFIIAQQSRLERVRNTILLDLGTALKQTARMGEAGHGRLVKILSIYRDFEASAEAVKILKDLKSN